MQFLVNMIVNDCLFHQFPMMTVNVEFFVTRENTPELSCDEVTKKSLLYVCFL